MLAGIGLLWVALLAQVFYLQESNCCKQRKYMCEISVCFHDEQKALCVVMIILHSFQPQACCICYKKY